MTISRQDSTPLLTSVEEGRVWNCIERRPTRHEKMKKMLQLKADRVGDGAGRGRKILQQRSTGWKAPRHRVRRALQQPPYPSGRWRPVTHTGTWLAGKEKQWEERWSFLSSRVHRDQAQKNRDCVGVLPMSKTTLECGQAAAQPRVERTAEQVILRRCLDGFWRWLEINCCSVIQC